MNHTEFWKFPLNFILKFSSLILTTTITCTVTLIHRNTEQWQVRLKSMLFGVRISNSPLLPFNSCFNIVHSFSVLRQTLFYVHLNNVLSGLSSHCQVHYGFYTSWCQFGVVGNDVGQINEVARRRARLVLRWVTVSGSNSRCEEFISVYNQPPRSTQPGHSFVGRRNEYQLNVFGSR